MKNCSLIISIVVCSVCLAVTSPIGNPTVPPSSTHSGLVRSPSPIDLNGNLLITGNVRGGREFRGFVPYNSQSEFYGSSSSSSLDSFMKRSAPINLRSGSGSYLPQPYYEPSRTVSSVRRGNESGLITYSSVRQTGGTGDFEVPRYVNAQAATGVPVVSVPYEYTISRPLSYTNPVELNKLVTYGILTQQERKDLLKELEKVGRGEEDIKTNTKSLQQDKDGSSIVQPIRPVERLEPAKPLENNQLSELYAKKSDVKSVYEQMLEEITPAPPAKQPKTDEKDVNDPNAGGMGGIRVVDQATMEAVKGIHKTFATESKDKFNYYMKTAEEFLRNGKYYRAADAYTLASIYNPGDPLAYAGRAHALFASGEYMSSAYYLMRAINIFPQYVEIKIDLNVMIPDKDRLENRIADITKWIDRTKSPELQFLLAYIYYQLDKPEQARNAIDASVQELSDNKAIQALRQEIEKNKN